MVRNNRILYVLSVLILVSLACGASSSATTSLSSSDKNATAIAVGVEATKNTNIKATIEAASFESTAQAMGAAAQSAVVQQTAAPMPATEAPLATETPPATEQVVVQPTPNEGSVATLQAQPMYDELQELLENNGIRSIEGTYHPVEDFEQVWYDPKTYNTWRTGYTASDFVIRADVRWRATDSSADFAQSGCGFVYGETDMDHYHATILAPDGVVHTYRGRGSEKIEMKGGRYYGALGGSSGEAEIMLVMENKIMALFVNGIETVRFKDPYFQLGNIGMTVMSGSYKGFQCTMTNIGFWELE